MTDIDERSSPKGDSDTPKHDQKSKKEQENVLEAVEQADTNEDGDSNEDAVSRTSTDKFEDHEPWATFQHRVADLCKTLWPDHAAEDIKIEHMPGRMDYRMAAIEVSSKKSSKRPKGSRTIRMLERMMLWVGDPISTFIAARTSKIQETPLPEGKFVLRVPRWEKEDLDYDKAVRNFVRRHIDFPVPEDVKVVKTSDNAVGSPFVLQKGMPGTTLKDLWPELNQKQRISVVEQIARYTTNMHAQSYNRGGMMGTGSSPWRTRPPIMQFSYDSPFNPDAVYKEIPAKPQKPIDMIVERLEKYQSRMEDYMPNWYTEPAEIAKSLHKTYKIYGPDCYYFHHEDFYPRHILAQVRDDSTVEITGILDWDAGYFAPAVVACTPPYWLWMKEYWVDGYVDEVEMSVRAAETPEDKDDLELKTLFDRLVGSGYTTFAYSKHAPMARKICDWATRGIWASWVLRESEATYAAYKKVLDEGDDAILREGQTLMQKALEAAVAVSDTYIDPAALSDWEGESDESDESNEDDGAEDTEEAEEARQQGQEAAEESK